MDTVKGLFEVYRSHQYWSLPCCNFLYYLSPDKYLVVTGSATSKPDLLLLQLAVSCILYSSKQNAGEDFACIPHQLFAGGQVTFLWEWNNDPISSVKWYLCFAIYHYADFSALGLLLLSISRALAVSDQFHHCNHILPKTRFCRLHFCRGQHGSDLNHFSVIGF